MSKWRYSIGIANVGATGETRAGGLWPGGWVVVYEHPDGDDPLVARIVTIWRQR
jgi:hypothetical protein